MVDPIEVGKRIREIRKTKLGYSMGVFAGKIDSKARSGTVSNWETGKNLPNNERLKRIAELGDVPIEELLYGSLEEYVKHVLIEDIENSAKFYEKFKEHYARNKGIPIEEVTQDTAKHFVDENINDMYEIMLSNQNILNRNSLINKKGEDLEIARSLIEQRSLGYGKVELITNLALGALSGLLPFETTFDEMYQLVKNKLSELPYYGNRASVEKLIELNLKKGMSEEAAIESAFNIYYKNKLSNRISDLEADIELINEEAQVKKRRIRY